MRISFLLSLWCRLEDMWLLRLQPVHYSYVNTNPRFAMDRFDRSELEVLTTATFRASFVICSLVARVVINRFHSHMSARLAVVQYEISLNTEPYWYQRFGVHGLHLPGSRHR